MAQTNLDAHTHANTPIKNCNSYVLLYGKWAGQKQWQTLKSVNRDM